MDRLMPNQLNMSVSKALALPETRGVTALVGGGGKTSLMYRLGKEYAGVGQRVIVTTTTRIGSPKPEDAYLISADEADADTPIAVPGRVTCVGERCEQDKLRFPGETLWKRCVRKADRVFAEADGAKMLPVKAPADYEPVIPPESDTVIAVAGLTALGQPIQDVVFRKELACPLLGASPEDPLTPTLLARLLTSPKGQFKGVDDPRKFRVFLNQADDARMAELGVRTAEGILTQIPGCRVVVGALRPAVKLWSVLT